MNGLSNWRTRVAAKVPDVTHSQFVEMDADNEYKCLIQTHTEYLTFTSRTMDSSQK